MVKYDKQKILKFINMKNTINTMFAAALVFSMVSFNALAEGNAKIGTVNTLLPATIGAIEVSAPEALHPLAQRVYSPAQRAAIVELDFNSPKQNMHKKTDLPIESVPMIGGPAPVAAQLLSVGVEYTPAQKASIVELTF
jgi:hypothetical protein